MPTGFFRSVSSQRAFSFWKVRACWTLTAASTVKRAAQAASTASLRRVPSHRRLTEAIPAPKSASKAGAAWYWKWSATKE